MTDTPTTQVAVGACVYCTTMRPIDLAACPECGGGWIDSVTSESAGSVAAAQSADLAAHAVANPNRRVRTRTVVALGVLGIAVLVGLIALTRDDAPAPASATTLTAPPTTAATTIAPTSTAPTTTSAPTTTVPVTTTSVAPTTTLPRFDAVGPALEPDQLRLGAFALGGFDFGSPAEAAIGALVATYGQPTTVQPADETWGLCSEASGRVIGFGGLQLITETVDGTETLAGYRLESSPATNELTTISGASVETTHGEMGAIYQGFDTITDATLGTIWVVRSSADGSTLLWGPAPDAPEQSSPVGSIYSPTPCTGGPGGN